MGRGLNPGPTKINPVHGQGFEPWTDQKIACMIVHAIAKYDRAHDRKISRAYKIRTGAQTSSTWNVSTG